MLVPELIWTDFTVSVVFYPALGFSISYRRPRERFVYLTRDGADLMLEQPVVHDRLYPRAELSHPFGRG